MWDYLTYTALILLCIVVAWEWLRGRAFSEGFTDGVVPSYFGRFFPRRYDVVPGQVRDVDGWIRNSRYFEGYVDIQGLGYKGDFCRVVEKQDMPDSRILACALAGQEGLDSLVYRTESQRAGMQFSRDDYFRDVNGDGRDDYCRIVKVAAAPNDAWEARAVLAGIDRFRKTADIQDTAPPPHIADLLWFYEGAMVWYRWFDDALDYAENTRLQIAGGASVDERPGKPTTEGLSLNRLPPVLEGTPPVADQFLKLGESPAMEFDTRVELRQLRAVSVWAYFDTFTNNARIFDFGNGAGKDNVLLGIEAPNAPVSGFGRMRAVPDASNKVCARRAAPEQSPQLYLATSDANVNEWSCPGPEPVDSEYPEDELAGDDAVAAGDVGANLLFEIWDSQQRKMRIRVLNVVPLKRWVHIALTTTDGSNFRPTWQVYVDGALVHEETNGHMPLKSHTVKNYIGRSNWEAVTANQLNGDERFRGALFDFRLYRAPMSKEKIARTVAWGLERLDRTPVS
jgi:hypothetical protein